MAIQYIGYIAIQEIPILTVVGMIGQFIQTVM
jgi:hypothetical protein